MKSNYPFNCWYVAATSGEVAHGVLGRRLLGIPVVLYRRAAGEVVAMEDRCVHRAYPLSAGRTEGDRLICGYHGFAFDPDGRCVEVPSQEAVPHNACVRTFSVIEQSPFIWIWLGDPGSARLRKPPDTPWFTEEDWACAGETLYVKANYMLLQEHYLDLTNVFAMHSQHVPPGMRRLPSLGEVEVSELSVSYSRAIPPAPLADWEAEATGLPRNREYNRREQGTFVSPALHVQRWTIEAENGPREQVRIHGFTPETPTTTHVFLQVARNYAVGQEIVGEYLRRMFRDMDERDAAVLETIQHRLVDDGARRDINVKADRAAVRARRVVEAMIAEETGRAPVPRRAGARRETPHTELV
jgi:vanillate O-demethylase monooxygenase subunit